MNTAPAGRGGGAGWGALGVPPPRRQARNRDRRGWDLDEEPPHFGEP